ncbi:MAG: OmpA family protein [Flavobacteriaceae bacterium]
MKKFSLIIGALALLLSVSTTQAQTWYFGSGAGLNFSGNQLDVAEGSPINTSEGCSIVNDENGNIIFYTDGKTVWNSRHRPLINGRGLLGNSSATQSALIIPIPNTKCQKYFIFTVDSAEHGLKNGLRYNVVDISNGGEVVIKNKLLYPNVAEKLTAVSDNNGGYWMLAHDFDTDLYPNKQKGNKFISFHIKSNDTDLKDPIISTVGSYHRRFVNKYNQYQNAQGQLKISPDGTKVALAVLKDNFIEIFDFADGIISNPKKYQFDRKTARVYGVEFSPNGSFVYFTHLYGGAKFLRRISIRKMTSSASAFPKTLRYNVKYPRYGYEEVKNLYQTPYDYALGALQLGPDENIYVANRTGGNAQPKIGVIQNPDSEIASFKFNSIPVSKNASLGSLMGLPTLLSEGACRCIDTDGDGVCDENDLCPTEPGPEDNEGCPYTDTDGDGVLDKDDKCVDAPGPAVNGGCPDKVITEDAERKLNEFAKTILFNTNEYTFKEGVTEQLDEIVFIMNQYKAAEFHIEGHTDSAGSSLSNLKLSDNRANAVRKYFIAHGISSKRLTAQGYGEEKPIDTNRTPEGRENNRRVTLTVINKKSLNH